MQVTKEPRPQLVLTGKERWQQLMAGLTDRGGTFRITGLGTERKEERRSAMPGEGEGEGRRHA